MKTAPYIVTSLSLLICAQAALAQGAKAPASASKAPAAGTAKKAPDLQPYLKTVSEKISAIWKPPAKTNAMKVMVNFTINANGTVSDVTVKEPSGDPEVDKLAIETIKKAAPFGPVNAGIPKFELNYGLPCKSGVTARGVDMNGYYDAMWSKIKQAWWVPKRLMYSQVKVKVSINKDGSLNDLSIAKPSGDANADKLALIAVKRAAPFDPLPEGAEVPFTVNYSLGYRAQEGDSTHIWNGEKIEKGGSYTTSGGVKMSLTDTTTEKDKADNARKETALIKMADLEEAMIKIEKSKGANSLDLLPLLRENAVQNQAIGEHKAAGEDLKRALKICQEPDNSQAQGELAKSLFALGDYQYSLSNFSEAETLIKQAISLKEETLKEKDADYKNMLNTYAKLLFKQNRTKEADEQYKKIKELG